MVKKLIVYLLLLGCIFVSSCVRKKTNMAVLKDHYPNSEIYYLEANSGERVFVVKTSTKLFYVKVGRVTGNIIYTLELKEKL